MQPLMHLLKLVDNTIIKQGERVTLTVPLDRALLEMKQKIWNKSMKQTNASVINKHLLIRVKCKTMLSRDFTTVSLSGDLPNLQSIYGDYIRPQNYTN